MNEELLWKIAFLILVLLVILVWFSFWYQQPIEKTRTITVPITILHLPTNQSEIELTDPTIRFTGTRTKVIFQDNLTQAYTEIKGEHEEIETYHVYRDYDYGWDIFGIVTYLKHLIIGDDIPSYDPRGIIINR